jgi:diphosphomevalonate decarboxylase
MTAESEQAAFVRAVLEGRGRQPAGMATASAPANLALCKYWGKRDATLNLPVTGSLSVSLGPLGTTTRVAVAARDRLLLEGRRLPARSPFAQRLWRFLDLFRPPGVCFHVETTNSVATAAGIASSASGFAALTAALDKLFDWHLEGRDLSLLARLGSGSACRSVYHGFVEWLAGSRDDGRDSYAVALRQRWPALRVGVLTITDAPKPLASRDAMARTVASSALYRAWPEQAAEDLQVLKQAIAEHNFVTLGRTAESNALAMHATMVSAWPPVLYWQPGTLEAMRRVWALRQAGMALYLSMDAGPNVKLLFLAGDEQAVSEAFPTVRMVAPFDDEAGVDC